MMNDSHVSKTKMLARTITVALLVASALAVAFLLRVLPHPLVHGWKVIGRSFELWTDETANNHGEQLPLLGKRGTGTR